MSERVREYIERCKQKLIDLSRRNRLLYFTPRKKTSLEVIHPDAISLFNQLVLDGRSLEIWLPPEEGLNTSDQSDSREDVLEGEEIKNLNIKKNQLACNLKDRDELEQTLKNIYRRATSDYRERGLRTLYVAFGILTWREIDTSENVHSPLVLVPVELKRESIRYPFTLYPIDEDVVINPALELRLQRDFKVDLPKAPDEWGETDLINFFDSIKKIIAGTPWSIDHAVYIAIFSFYKLVMYDDLDKNIEIVSSNPMVSSLGEGTLREDLIINDLPDEKGLDTIQQSIDTLQILNADSSQQLCIQHALRGQSFIIQGPPGTGKSQTIANIISEFVARGKRVLFVSEKMAALEVVYKRLKAAGLSDFCLELHSHKADKHEVISELSRCLEEIPVPQKFLSNSEFKKIDFLKNYLNDYVEAIHKKYGLMEWSTYEIIGKLCKLQELPYIPVEFDNESLTPEEFLKIEDLVKKVKSIWKVAKEGDNFSWKGFREIDFTFALRREVISSLQKLIDEIETLASVTSEYTSNTGLEHFKVLFEIEWLVKTAKFLKERFRPEPHWLSCSDAEIIKFINEVNRFQKIYEVYRKSKMLFEIYNEKFFNLSLEKLNKRFNKTYTKWYFRWINPLYYWDRYTVTRSTKTRKFPSSFKGDLQKALELIKDMDNIKNILPDQIATLITDEAITNFERYINEEKVLSIQFGSYFKKLLTNWNEILDTLKWTVKVRELFVGKQITTDFVKLICREVDITTLCDKFIESYSKLKEHLEEFERFFESNRGFLKMESLELKNKLEYLLSHIDDLQIWLNFKSIERQFKQTKFSDFFQRLVEKAPSEEYLLDIYRKSVYQSWLENILTGDFLLGEFQRQYHEQQIEEFRSLDKKLVDFSPFHVIKRASGYRPSKVVDLPGSEVAILKKESARIKRHMFIRRLFRSIPNLLFRLKPCLMMSPMSVSQFLLPNVQFDLVVFDEASQISPEDAIGSIYRGKQIIVVGDDKQLPPTPFFKKTFEEEDIDWDNPDDEIFADLDSILKECATLRLPERMLRWHYRSRYESLIAFSNKWFYDWKLVTFPCSLLEREVSSIEFRYVEDGVYDRGGRRDNKREAETVVDLFFDHFNKSPNKSLGVVTFNLPQKFAIDDEIERRLKENIEFEKFFKEDRLEGFFVKNLEDVQGDERDVMVFSVGYGKDEQGIMTMNFGPLNKPGGEKRLNVAVTRAREKVIVVSSIKAADIDLKKTNAAGVIHLQRYLDYAERGRNALQLETKLTGEPESLFEEDVANEIRKLGYEVIPQVGCSRYRIDIGVMDPSKPGFFLLGVECDGATYHSSHTARDRDRLRQHILEKLGWRIHRIWSLDWILRRQSEVERLRQVTEKARKEESRNIFENEGNSKGTNDPQTNIEDAIKYRKLSQSERIPGAVSYRICNIDPKVLEKLSFNSQIELVVSKIMEAESPIHIRFLAKRTARILNFRCTEYFFEKVKRAVENLLTGSLFERNQFKIRKDFLWSLSMKDVPVRVPVSHLPETCRLIEYISPEEIQNAMLVILRNSFSIGKESLIDATAKLFGIKRKGFKIQNTLFKVYEKMVKKGQFVEEDGQVTLAQEVSQG